MFNFEKAITYTCQLFESDRGEPRNERCTQCCPIVMSKIEYFVSEGRRFCYIEGGLLNSWVYQPLGRNRCTFTFSKGKTNESKYQSKKSSNNSRRFKESDTEILDCSWAPGPGGLSQSHAEVLNPCNRWWRLSDSYRRQLISCSRPDVD